MIARSSVSSVEEEKSIPDTATKTQKRRKSRKKPKTEVSKQVEIDKQVELSKISDQQIDQFDKQVDQVDKEVDQFDKQVDEQVDKQVARQVDPGKVEIVAADSMEMEAIPDSSDNQEEWVVIS